ncbi:hypothetical protein CL617_05765 [archaeon]|nr:hypothetical protein [archaeon]|tara:strand:- start:4812 stop:5057 length:246 start_codon:yes stop_codon:yes gene_type:complete
MKFKTKDKITSIQLHENTKDRLKNKKEYKEESYDSVVKKLLNMEDFPSMEEMFKESDKIKQEKIYTTKEVIELSHRLRGKR